MCLPKVAVSLYTVLQTIERTPYVKCQSIKSQMSYDQKKCLEEKLAIKTIEFLNNRVKMASKISEIATTVLSLCS